MQIISLLGVEGITRSAEDKTAILSCNQGNKDELPTRFLQPEMQFFSFDKTQSNKPFTTLGLLVVKDKFRDVNFEAYVKHLLL